MWKTFVNTKKRNGAENGYGHVRIVTGCGFREGAHFWSQAVLYFAPFCFGPIY